MPITEITRERIIAAHQLIKPHIRRTPVVEVGSADFGLDPMHLIFKLELLQHSGSFKARGAFSNLLSRTIPAAGVVAASGGNHGVAVAFAAMKLGKPARIFVPTVCPSEKLERIRGYGADLVVTGERYADSLAASEGWAAVSGALRIHAYDQVETLLGQGTVGLEFEEQAPNLDTLLVAVGGGGLIGGVSAWYSGRIKVIGVEPEAAPTLTMALQAGRPVDSPAGGIAADSLAPKRVGELMSLSRRRTYEACCSCPTSRFSRLRKRSGKFFASWRNQEAPRLLPHCSLAVISPNPASASESWFAVAILRPWISAGALMRSKASPPRRFRVKQQPNRFEEPRCPSTNVSKH